VPVKHVPDASVRAADTWRCVCVCVARVGLTACSVATRRRRRRLKAIREIGVVDVVVVVVVGVVFAAVGGDAVRTTALRLG